MSTYLGVLLLAGAVPLVVSFYPPLKFWYNFKALFMTLSLIVIIFGGWDIFAVWHAHWNFSPGHIYGWRILNLPIEEWLFFVVIPFCCIFTWEAVLFIKKRMK